jgi:hypothetical protein
LRKNTKENVEEEKAEKHLSVWFILSILDSFN